MRKQQMTLFAVLALSTVLQGCGGAISTDTADKALGAVFTSLSTISSDSSGRMLARVRETAMTRAREVRSALREQAFRRMIAESPRSTMALEDVDGFVSPEGMDCTFQMDAADLTNMRMVLSCTTTAATTASCGSDDYTMASGATMSFDSTTSINADTYEIDSMAVSFAFEGDVSGGDLGSDAVAFDCSMGMSLSAEDIAAESQEFECSDADFSCTIGGQTFSCEDLNRSTAGDSCDTSAL